MPRVCAIIHAHMMQGISRDFARSSFRGGKWQVKLIWILVENSRTLIGLSNSAEQ